MKLVERIAAAMVECHHTKADAGRYAEWPDWLKTAKQKDFNGEHAREWVAARRKEARAILKLLQGLSAEELIEEKIL